MREGKFINREAIETVCSNEFIKKADLLVPGGGYHQVELMLVEMGGALLKRVRGEEVGGGVMVERAS